MNNSMSILIYIKTISQNGSILPHVFQIKLLDIESLSINLMVIGRVIKDLQGQSTTMELQKCCMDLFKLLIDIFSISVTIIFLSILKHHLGRLSYIMTNHPSMARAHKIRNHLSPPATIWFYYLLILLQVTIPVIFVCIKHTLITEHRHNLWFMNR